VLKNKNILFVVCLIIVLCLAGCANDTPGNDVVTEPNNQQEQTNNTENAVFDAEVIEVLDKSVMVQPVDGSNELNSSDRISIALNNIDIKFNLVVGQIIKITYDGIIAESYPAQILGTKKIELVKDFEIPNISNDSVFENGEKIEKDFGVSLEAKNVSASGLTIDCHQSGGTNIAELETGSYYEIYRLEDNGYVKVEYAPQEHEIGWTAEAYVITKGGTSTWEVNWEWLYGKLPAGKYRIGKEIMNFRGAGDFDQGMIYADFEIK